MRKVRNLEDFELPRYYSQHFKVNSRVYMQRKILITSALPYVSGSIHLGTLLEEIQTDIWVRFQRLTGNHCIYVCGDDAHGTATMLLAEREGIDPEVLIESFRQEHVKDFEAFHIEHDNYHTTHSDENTCLP